MKRELLCLSLLGGFGGMAVAEKEVPVEAEVRAAFEEALKVLPDPVRAEVGDVTLLREPDLGIPDDAPLEYRLLNRAAFAAFSVGPRTLTVFDAGVAGTPRWGQEAPAVEELVPFLAGLADVLGVEVPKSVEDPAVGKAWEAFAERVYGWRGERVPRSGEKPGDPAVLDRFLEDGVWRSMGGKVPTVQLLVHEFGHALQLQGGLGSMGGRMGSWASLSGFTETSDGEPTDGFAKGMNTTEQPLVLIRLILSEHPDAVARGAAAVYAAGERARFVNRYARYDLREDYAECFRLMAFAPERLVKVAPEKFLYLNALGWNARLDAKSPGPLWYSGEEFDGLLPSGERLAVTSRLLGADGTGPALSPVALGSVLRAHAGELSKAEMPEPHEVIATPEDLPVELQSSLRPADLQAEIDGLVFMASAEVQRRRTEEQIVRWIDHHEFMEGILKLLASDAAGLREQYQKDVVKQADIRKRVRSYEVLRERCWGDLPAAEWRAMDRVEAKKHEAVGNKSLAARYAILAEEGNHAARMKRAVALAKDAPRDFDRVRLIATAADVAMEAGDVEMIRGAIAAIPGGTTGAWLRVKYWLRLAEVVGEGDRDGVRAAARADADAVVSPELRKLLLQQVEEAGEDVNE